MTRALAIVFTLALLPAATADGHQLDELVQSVKVDVAHERVRVDLTLSPGAAVASRVLAEADRNRDERVSPEELHQYAAAIVAELVLIVDGRRLPFTLTRAESSSNEEFADGMGTIRLRAETAGRPFTPGHHTVSFENMHAAAMSVFLANALKPSDTTIAIHALRRDRLQRTLELDIEAATRLSLAGPGLLFVAFVLLAGVRGRHLFRS